MKRKPLAFKNIFRWRAMGKWLQSVGLVCVGLALALNLHLPARGTLSHSVRLSQSPVADWIEEGKQDYQGGRFQEAIDRWQQAESAFEDDWPDRALVPSYLALALSKLGRWQEAYAAIDRSLEELQKTDNPATIAQVLNVRGHIEWTRGRASQALDLWQQAETHYQQAGDEEGVTGSQINQARALQTLGLYRRSRTLLEQVADTLEAQPDSSLQASALGHLGNVLRRVGDFEASQRVWQQSLEIAERLQLPVEIEVALLGLGNTTRATGKWEEALTFYDRAAAIATSETTRIQARVNQLSLAVDTERWTQAQSIGLQILPQLTRLPASRLAIDSQINAASSLMELANEPTPFVRPLEIARLLAHAVEQARTLGDLRAESSALGELGYLYERSDRTADALDLTERALTLAQAIDAPEVAYQWHWQIGRLFALRGESPEAIAAYTEAVGLLQSLRQDLVAIDPTVQFSFRDRVEPVYRELVGLLLKPGASQKDLKQARETIEALQLAQLENFFREVCLEVRPQQIDGIDPTAAVFYPIILPQRLAVILSVPGQPLSYYETAIPQTEVEDRLKHLRNSLHPIVPRTQHLELARQVYDWLIRPASEALTGIQTLTFVPDGPLRNLPMAILHDGERYLIERYGIAFTPGLQLLAAESLMPENLEILLGGLTEARQGFSALPSVGVEIEHIATLAPSQVFLNRDFTEANLKTLLDRLPFRVVHLATHGQFSSKPEDTFILTWDEKVGVRELKDLLEIRNRNESIPIELLVLSACQTASGDDRAALGLAGLAVRSGTRSTLATLWSVNDRATAELMVEFYQQLATRTSKAEALRQAQLALLYSPEFARPYYWAAFVLVGNWL